MTILATMLRSVRSWIEKDWTLAIRLVVISAVFFAGVYLAPRIADCGQRLPTLEFSFYLEIILVILFIRWPNLGLIMVIAGAAFVIECSECKNLYSIDDLSNAYQVSTERCLIGGQVNRVRDISHEYMRP